MAGLKRIRVAVALALSLLLIGPYAPTQSQSVSTITPPSAQFGANVGDDYFLATYTQLEAYWKKLAQESDRLRLVDIGRTEEGRSGGQGRRQGQGRQGRERRGQEDHHAAKSRRIVRKLRTRLRSSSFGGAGSGAGTRRAGWS